MNHLKRYGVFTMQVRQAIEYFQLGVIASIYAMRDPLDRTKWILGFELSNGDGVELRTARGDVKTFSSLDTLAGEVETITGRLDGMTFKV